MALAHVERLTFTYPDAGSPALHDVSVEIEEGELVAVFGTSGSGKSTLLRALSGLVPHFHGGRFEGRVEVSGNDTRTIRPAELTGTVATVFQDPEEQIVLTPRRTRGRFRAGEPRHSSERDPAAGAPCTRNRRCAAARRSSGVGALRRRVAARCPGLGACVATAVAFAGRADLAARPRCRRVVPGARCRAGYRRRDCGAASASRARTRGPGPVPRERPCALRRSRFRGREVAWQITARTGSASESTVTQRQQGNRSAVCVTSASRISRTGLSSTG